MSKSNNFPGVRLTFHVINGDDVDIELEWDDENLLPESLVGLLAYMRGEEGLANIVDAFKKVCKSTKRKDLYRSFTMLLKSMALQHMVDKDIPMISALEVLGKKRMS